MAWLRSWWATTQSVVIRLRISQVGLVVAVVFVSLSLTPSLLPRTWLIQGVISGLSGSVGYGLGVLLALMWSWAMPDRWQPAGRTRHWLRVGFLALAGALLAVSLFVGSRWQRSLYALLGEPTPGTVGYIRVLILTVVIITAVVGLARGIVALDRLATQMARRVLPRMPATIAGIAVVGVLGIIIVDGVLHDGLISFASSTSSSVNNSTVSDAQPPTIGTRSGSPRSLVTWDSLGREGRTFVAGGPGAAELREFTGAPAKEPIRVYVGLHPPGDTPADNDLRAADLAVRELERTDAASRAILCVVTTTGTGWVDPYAAAALEYLFGGDTAIVGTQFSFLPSWLSFLTERDRAAQAGRVLFNRVYAYWSALPPEHRPRLVILGESLGSFGSEAAFSDLDDLRRHTDGALLLGPTNANPLWGRLVAGRDPGSSEVAPVYAGGQTVRFASRPQDLQRPDGPWPTPRVVYLQNPSDPVTWWSPRLLFDKPDWLAEPRGYDVQPAMRWYPVVTFFQVTADLALAQRTRSAHGHYFRGATVAAWVAITQPAGWTDARSADLTRRLDHEIPYD